MSQWLKKLRADRPLGENRNRLAEILGDDMHWVNDSALCAQTDAETFFPDRGRISNSAKELCDNCPLQPDCLAYSLTHEVFGVWGGLGDTERKRALNARDLEASIARHPAGKRRSA